MHGKLGKERSGRRVHQPSGHYIIKIGYLKFLNKILIIIWPLIYARSGVSEAIKPELYYYNIEIAAFTMVRQQGQFQKNIMGI